MLGLVAAMRQQGRRLRDQQGQALLLWGGWLLTQAIVFSVAGSMHPYYLALLAPAVSALTGIGVVALWSNYRTAAREWWLLPLAIVLAAATQAHLMGDYPAWARYLTPPVVVGCAVATGALLYARTRAGSTVHTQRIAVTCGILVLLLAPIVWSAVPVLYPRGTALPVAGPDVLRVLEPPPPDPALVRFLQANRGATRFIVATPDAAGAAHFILATGQPALAFGGFAGNDHVFSPTRMAALAARNTLRFVLLPPTPVMEQRSVEDWVRTYCAPVPADQWQSGPPLLTGSDGFSQNGLQLYDCAP